MINIGNLELLIKVEYTQWLPEKTGSVEDEFQKRISTDIRSDFKGNLKNVSNVKPFHKRMH